MGLFLAQPREIEQNFASAKFFEIQRFQYFRYGETEVSPTLFPVQIPIYRYFKPPYE